MKKKIQIKGYLNALNVSDTYSQVLNIWTNIRKVSMIIVFAYF